MSLTSYRAAPPRDIASTGGVGIVSDRMHCLPRRILSAQAGAFLLGRPGGDLLSRVLGRSTIGAEGFHGRVRDGIGCIAPRNDHQVVKEDDARAFARAVLD